MSYLSFKLNDEFIEEFSQRKIPWGFVDAAGNSVSELVFIRTYSRKKDDGTKEKWYEVCRRVIEGMYSIQKDYAVNHKIPWNDNKAQKSAQEAFDRMFNFKWTPPGRGLWAMGTPLVNRDKNSAPLQNCAFVSTSHISKTNPGDAFAWLMEASMLGIGVGFDVNGAKKELEIKNPAFTGTHVIPDTREGWCEAVRITVNAFLTGNDLPDFDYSQIRPEGEPIKTFGGTASGPEPLKKLIKNITNLLLGNVGRTLDSLTIIDIMNMIGVCVVAGNVRRTAELAMGSVDDDQFINAKNYKDNEYRQSWGWMCLPKNTWIMTDEGAKTVEDLVDTKFNALIDGNSYETSSKGFFVTSEEEPVYKIILESGYELEATENHPVMTSEKWKRVDRLSVKDKVKIAFQKVDQWEGTGGSFGEGYLLGSIWADGWISEKRAYVCLYGDEYNEDYAKTIEKYAEKLGCECKFQTPTSKEEHRLASKVLYKISSQYGFTNKSKRINKSIEKRSINFYKGFLSAAFDGDGTFPEYRKGSEGGQAILCQSNYEDIQAVQRMLSRLGIYSSIRKASSTGYNSEKMSYTLAVASRSLDRFYEMIDLHNPCKIEKLSKIIESRDTVNSFEKPYYSKVKSVTFDRMDKVYDVTIDEVHFFDANGIQVHNSNNSVAVKVGDDLSGIVDNIAINGEPGIIWMDLSREYGRLIDPPDNKDYRVAGYNPCQPGWAKVLTPEGIREFNNISIDDRVWSKEGWTTITNKWCTGKNEVYKYKTSAGVFYGTENHRVVSKDSEKIEVKDAETIEVLEGQHEPANQINPVTVMDGLLIGDGSIHKASNNLIHLCIGENDQDYFNSEISYLIGKHRPGLMSYAYEVENTRLTYQDLELINNRIIPDRYIRAGKDAQYSFLRGLFSANGSVVRNRITLKAVSKQLIEEVQMMLSGLGIRSYITKNKPSKISFANGAYECAESYDLNITTDRKKFVESIGFIQQYKNEKIEVTNTHYKKSDYDIISKELISIEDTFDITVDNESHTYWTQGCNVSNCAEQSLEHKEMCTLVESYIGNHESVEDYKRTLKFAYLYAKTVTLMPTHWEETNAVMKRNRRIGTSMSDIANFVDNHGMPVLKEMQDEGYKAVQYYDKVYSEWLGVRESIKTTTVKPSGTVSLLAGASPGVHWAPGGEYHKRGVVFRAKDPVVEEFRKAGYICKPYAYDPEGSVFIQFNIRSRAKRSEQDVTIFEKIHLASIAQKYWSDNSVSVTISYNRETEAQYVPTVISMYEGSLKTVSFLPMGNETYDDMPYQSSDENQYENDKNKLKPVNTEIIYSGGEALEAEGEKFCNTDTCEIPTGDK